MALPHPPFHGSCLCSSVQVRITAPPLLTFACHCRDCQKLTASAYSLSTMFPSDSFSVSGDLITGGLGAGGRTHYFCASCLGFIYSQIDGADGRVNVRTSLLDQSASFKPFIEVMTEEKLPWAKVLTVHSFAQRPASPLDLDALMTAYTQATLDQIA